MFVELMPLLKERTLLITVARLDEQLKVNVIPTRAKEGEDQALTTPLSYTGSPEELDAELGKHLASYVASHVQLGSTLAEAKAEMEAAAKAALQKVKATQQTSKPDQTAAKQQPIPRAGDGRDYRSGGTVAVQLRESDWDEGLACDTGQPEQHRDVTTEQAAVSAKSFKAADGGLTPLNAEQDGVRMLWASAARRAFFQSGPFLGTGS